MNLELMLSKGSSRFRVRAPFLILWGQDPKETGGGLFSVVAIRGKFKEAYMPMLKQPVGVRGET